MDINFSEVDDTYVFSHCNVWLSIHPVEKTKDQWLNICIEGSHLPTQRRNASNQRLTVLGLDPGSRFSGYGLLSYNQGNWQHIENGVIKLDSKKPICERLHQLSEQLQLLFSQYDPFLTIVERVFLGKNVSSAFTLGHARGVILCEASRAGSEIVEYAPRAVKKGVTGHGAASKTQMQSFLSSFLGVSSFVKDDASDALALALHGARQWEMQQRLGSQSIERGV